MPILTYTSTIPTDDVNITYDMLLRRGKEKRTEEKDDDSCLGWRYATRVLPDGTTQDEYRPLTILDVLFPEEGDKVSVRNRHTICQNYAYNAMKATCRFSPSMVAFQEMRIDFGMPGLRPLAPDAALVSGVKKPKDFNWSTFYVKEEGATVELVMEITSPTTRYLDVDPSLLTENERNEFLRKKQAFPELRPKWEIYAEAGVRIYVVQDEAHRIGLTSPPVFVYYLDEVTKKYVLCQPDALGRVWIEITNMFIGTHNGDVSWFDKHGIEIADYTEMTQARYMAEERAQYIVERLQKTEERVRDTTQREMARKMLAKGIEPSTIADITSLSVDDVIALVKR